MRDVLLHALAHNITVTIVSGAKETQAMKQTQNLPCFYLGQNGNNAIDGKTGAIFWRRDLTPAQKKEIFAHIASLPRTEKVKDENDLVDDRGCQISYSLIGHNEDIVKKEACDPDHKKRLALLKEYPLHSKNVQVKSAGTTCLDYFEKGKHKGFNVAAFITLNGWKKNECIYIGDALFPGGNDETVVGVIKTKAVKNPKETFSFLTRILKGIRT